MTGKRLFIKADEVCSDRFLDYDEMFKKEKNWNINLSKERQFANGECIITDKDDTAYSIDELINLLNYLHREHYLLKEENKMLKNNVGKLSEDVRFLAKLDDHKYKKTYTKEIYHD